MKRAADSLMRRGLVRHLALVAAAVALGAGAAWVGAALSGRDEVSPALPTPPCSASGSSSELLSLATTTSVSEIGLLADLLPRFQQATGIRVDAYPLGSGKALERGRKGAVDALLVHSPAEERAFVAAGDGIERRTLFTND